jgi:hypothetical protein
MPPGGKKNKLSSEQAELIKQWIQEGADYSMREDQ